MGASSVTGKGNGESGKLTSNALSMLANGPMIYVAGSVENTTAGDPVSPPTTDNHVRFPNPLPGPSSDYVVILTTQNAGAAYVYDMLENDDGDFIGFYATTPTEGLVMYIVVKKGIRPNV